MTARKVILGICRLLVGALFIFSGFIKANDPLGFAYKLDEYFGVFGMTRFFTDSITPYFSMIICVFEIFVGAALLLGVLRNFTAWMLLIMIIFFSFLTFYSAYFNKVTDCGCFGDAIHLTPWQSFSKDLILLVLIIPIFIFRRDINPLFAERPAMTSAFVVLLASTLFTLFCYYYLPVIDFRPYAIGKDLWQQTQTPPNAVKDSIVMMYTYKDNVTGKEVKLTGDSMTHMDSITSKKFFGGYTYVDRKDEKIREGYKPPIHDFTIQLKDSEVTPAFWAQKGYRLMIVQYNVEKSATRFQSELNKLTSKIMAGDKVKIWALSSSGDAIVEAYRQAYKVPYTFYTVDGTVLKTITRSNPGLVLLHDNVVLKKWPATALPSYETLMSYCK